MLFPKRTKFRKMHRRDSYKKEFRVYNLSRGEFGIKCILRPRIKTKRDCQKYETVKIIG